MKSGVAVIGYGRFGRLLARLLSTRARVLVYNRRRNIRATKNIQPATLRQAIQCDIIILAVPVSELRPLLRRMSPAMNARALVIDVCSVKEAPLRWMKESLPASVQILGTHPLFGPSGATEGIRGKHVVLCRGRIPAPKFRRIRRLLERAGLIIHVMTSTGHDRWIASTLFVTQLVGRGLSRLVPSKDLPTKSFRHLREIISIASADSPELVRDIYRFNRYAREVPGAIWRALKVTLSSGYK